MPKRILVVGGTGMLGLPVARQLKFDSFDVTILTTNKDRAAARLGDEFRLVQGDIRDEKSLRSSMENQDFVFLNLNSNLDPTRYEEIEIGGTKKAAAVAREHGIKRIGTITTASSKGELQGVIYLDAKVKAEQALKESGVPYTIFRPSWFFESLPLFVQNGRAAILGKQPIPRLWLAASDYARQVSRAFQTDQAVNKCFYNLGPQPMTMMEAVTKYCSVAHPKIKPTSMAFFQAKLLSILPGMKMLRQVIPFFKYYDQQFEAKTDDEADRILGPNLTSLEEWLDQSKK